MLPMKIAKSLPVLMHHYISNYQNTISVSPRIFEDHCCKMAEKGWRGVSLAEAEAFFIDNEPLPAKTAWITFDDGYLDNYYNALPILKKYGHCGVMFAVTDRLEKETKVPVSIEELMQGKVPTEPEVHKLIQPNAAGYTQRNDVFCSQEQARLMDADGTMAVAGHSRSHLGAYIDSNFSGFNIPKDQGRTFYLTSYGNIWGMPLFPVKPALANRAFLPNEEMIAAIKALVPQDIVGAKEFFAHPKGLSSLQDLMALYMDKLGRFETDQEQQERMWGEIAGGKTELEAILGHTLQTLCWPWGECCPTSVALAQDAGYKVLVTVANGINTPADGLSVHRFKVRSKPAKWLLSRLAIYSHPLLGKLYLKLR